VLGGSDGEREQFSKNSKFDINSCRGGYAVSVKGLLCEPRDGRFEIRLEGFNHLVRVTRSGYTAKKVRLWELPSGEEVLSMEKKDKLYVVLILAAILFIAGGSQVRESQDAKEVPDWRTLMRSEVALPLTVTRSR
jgi:hypothetical protein